MSVGYLFRWCAIFAIAISFNAASVAQPVRNAVDTQVFTPGLSLASVLQPDGRVIVAGNFVNVGGVLRNNIVRLNADGSVDPSWNVDVFGINVTGLALTSKGDVILAGDFRKVNGVPRLRLAKVSGVDGTLDMQWDPSLDREPLAVAVDRNDNVYIGGYFEFVGKAPRRSLARIPASGNGEADPDWILDVDVGGFVRALAVDGSGRVFIGGDFRRTKAPLMSGFARLTATGAVDPDFHPGVARAQFISTGVRSGVEFVYVSEGTTAVLIANLDGAVAPTERIYADNTIRAVHPGSDGAIYVSGDFTTVNGILRRGAAKLVGPGSQGFQVAPWKLEATDNYVQAWSIGFDSRGRLLFGSIAPSTNGVERGGLLAIDPVTAQPDPAWPSVLVAGWVSAIGHDFAGRTVIGGRFNFMTDGTPRHGLARILPDGTLDRGWNAHGSWNAEAIVFDSANDVYVADNFSASDGRGGAYLRKFDGTSGAPVLNWNPDPDRPVHALLFDGNAIIAAGNFKRVGGVQQRAIARLSLADATVDPQWNPVVEGAISAIAAEAGKLYLGGCLKAVGGFKRDGLARLDRATAAVDPDWGPAFTQEYPCEWDGFGPDRRVRALAADGNGHLFVAGWYATIGGLPITPVAKVSMVTGQVDPVWKPSFRPYEVESIAHDGKSRLYVTGAAASKGTQTWPTFVRIRDTKTGEIDPTWQPDIPYTYGPHVISAAKDGRVHIGGGVASAGAVARIGYIELALSPRPPSLDVDEDGLATALTDGVMILRRMFGLSGAAVGQQSIGIEALVSNPNGVVANIDDMRAALDIDDDGRVDPLTDGILIVRYLFGLRGKSLVDHVVSATAKRTDPTAIEAYLASLMP